MTRKSESKEDLGDYVKDKGASLTFTFKEGLVVQILPNGAVQQTIPANSENVRKQSVISSENSEDVPELNRMVTREGSLIR